MTRKITRAVAEIYKKKEIFLLLEILILKETGVQLKIT